MNGSATGTIDENQTGSQSPSFPRKILWFASSGLNTWGNEVLSIFVQGEGGAQHFAGEDDMHCSGGQGFGALEVDVVTPSLGACRGHGGRDQQAAPLGMAALGEAASASMLAGFIGARIQSQIGDQGVGVAKGEALEQSAQQAGHQRAHAANGFKAANQLCRRGIAAGKCRELLVDGAEQSR